MPEPEWYRRLTWTDADRRDFETRLKRCRGSDSKAQYLRIQAVHLAEAGLHEAAVALLDRLFGEFPEPIQLAQAHAQKAGSLAKLGRIDPALDEYRAAMKVEREVKGIRTQAWLDFGWLVIEQEYRNFYGELTRVLQEFRDESALSFPLVEYRYHAVQAVLAEAAGETEAARQLARVALIAADKKHSGLARHPKVGLVGPGVGAVHKRLQALARQ